ncbi:MAG: hypothetical protein K2H04_09630 [Bacteroidaceae bacterium]|nr:hypothetical protein [Bacteroidaceae bacterium]
MAFKYDYNKERTSVEWQRKVDEIRQRDNYTCQLCGTQNKQVQVHHTWYNQNLHYWESPNEQLITLCKDCHSKETLNQLNKVYGLEVLRKTNLGGTISLKVPTIFYTQWMVHNLIFGMIHLKMAQ